MKTRKKMPIIFLIIIIVPILIFTSIYTFRQVQKDGNQDAISNNMLVADSVQIKISNLVENNFEALEMLSKYPEVQTFDTEILDPILDDAVSVFPYIKPIGIADNTGMQIAKSNGAKKVDISDRDHFSFPMNGTDRYISNILTSKADGSYICIMAVPIIDPVRNEPNGVVVGFLDLSTLDDFVTTIEVEGSEYVEKHTTSFIVDSEGFLLAHPSVEFAIGEQRPNYSSCQYVKEGLNKKSSTMTYVNESGENILVSYVVEPSTGWIVCSEVPLDVAQNDLKRKLTVLLLLYLTVIAILGVIIVFLSLNIRKRKEAELLLGSLNDTLEEKVEQRGKELERTMKELMDRERLASLGSLVAGVAHEINTPLGVAVSAGSHLEHINNVAIEKLSEGKLSKHDFVDFMEQVSETIEIVNSNTYRASELINNFKKISADQSGDVESVFDLHEYIESVIKTLRHEYKHQDYVFKIECDRKLRIKSYPGAWAQIFTNFIMNSLLHGFEGRDYGQIDIKCRYDDETLFMTYTDNGKGMTENVVKRIFDPFFTTNRGKGGTGLGMNIVYNIVASKLGGKIVCKSKINEGTEFVISVPVKQEDDDERL